MTGRASEHALATSERASVGHGELKARVAIGGELGWGVRRRGAGAHLERPLGVREARTKGKLGRARVVEVSAAGRRVTDICVSGLSSIYPGVHGDRQLA